jgi:Zn ribbon nucleic-acid-binding protein
MSGAANMALGATKPNRWRYAKMLPCPECASADDLNVFEYESGWKRVECEVCFTAGPSRGRINDAIVEWNAIVGAKT